MKNLLLIIPSAIILLAACKSENKTNLDADKNIVFTDTSLLKNANASTDVASNTTSPVEVATPAPEPKVQVRTITKIVRVTEKAPTPKNNQTNTAPVIVPPVQQTETTTSPSETAGNTNTGGVGNTGTSGTSGNIPTPDETKKKNEGWSQAAKGATIGGVGGAVAGAVIGKGAKGAAIGGIIGAAGGYILGRKQDKKSGRVEYTTTDTGIYKKQ